MSKLSENLKAYPTGNRYAQAPILNCVAFKATSYEIPPYHMEYNLECKIGSTFVVPARNSLHETTVSVQSALYRCKRQILEEIFGEFRQDLYNLDVALYNQDYEKAETLLDGVIKNMFDY